jgi:hypothetical protein
MFLVGPKVFSFVVKGVSHILRGSKGVGVEGRKEGRKKRSKNKKSPNVVWET